MFSAQHRLSTRMKIIKVVSKINYTTPEKTPTLRAAKEKQQHHSTLVVIILQVAWQNLIRQTDETGRKVSVKIHPLSTHLDHKQDHITCVIQLMHLTPTAIHQSELNPISLN